MGSDFSCDDLAKSAAILTGYTHEVTATAQAGGHTVWTIDAVPKPGAPVVWGKVTLQVRAHTRMPFLHGFVCSGAQPARSR